MRSLSTALALAFVVAALQNSNAGDPQMSTPQQVRDEYDRHKQTAIRINDLAGQIHSEADARAYVSEIAVLFAKELPPAWAQDEILQRIARAEYESVNDSAKLIPEDRIVAVWNKYVRAIGAPDEAIVTAAEIHNMRDAEFTGVQKMWVRGIQNAWTMPNVFALGQDGKVAGGCRALETVRVMHDLHDLFQNLRNARDRLQKGIVLSDALNKRPVDANSHRQAASRIMLQTDISPVRLAESRYVQEHGSQAYLQLLKSSFDELFPSE